MKTTSLQALTMTPIELIKKITTGERDFELPFTLAFADGELIECQQVLRYLPYKRIVLRVICGGQTCLLKFFMANARRAAQREYKNSTALHALGLRTPQLLKSAEFSDGSTFHLYAWVSNAHVPTSENRQDIKSVHDIIQWLQQLNIKHLDMHPDNFLINNEGLWLIDVGALQFDKAVSLVDALGQWIGQFYPWQYSLLAEQAGYDCKLVSSAPIKIMAIAKKCWEKRKTDYLEKSSRDCSMTHVEKTFFQLLACRRSFMTEKMRSFLGRLDNEIARAQMLKNGNTATVVKTVCDDLAVVIKRYNLKNPWHAFVRLFRQSRAELSWRNAHILEIAGISTPQPLAIVSARWGWLRRKAFFICAAQDGIDLLALGRQRILNDSEYASLKKILKTMRFARISHGDLKATNLIVHDGEISVIDLDAMKQHYSFRQFENYYLRDLQRLKDNWLVDDPIYQQINFLVNDLVES